MISFDMTKLEGKSLLEKIKISSAEWSPLKKVNDDGFFDFNTCIVVLESLSLPMVQGIKISDLQSETKIDLATYHKLSKILPLAIHEFAHFVDSTSTVWGLNHLRIMDKAYNCDSDDVNDFYHMREFHNHCKRLKLPEYYTVINRQFDKTGRWTWAISSGKEFIQNGNVGKRPILFGRFSNKAGELLVRCPISIISLLESCAMAEEIESSASLIQRIDDENERIVEQKIYEKKLVKQLYDIDLSEYSVCAHMVANHFLFPDARIVYLATALIARVVLNTSKMAYYRIDENFESVCTQLRIDHKSQIGQEIRKAIQYHNPGSLFHILCTIMPKDALKNLATFQQRLLESFETIGVDPDFYLKSSVFEARITAEAMLESNSPSLAELSRAGFMNFTQIMRGFGVYDIQKMHLPPVMLGDVEIYNLHNAASNTLATFDLEAAYDELVEGQLRVQAFSEACM